MFSSPTAQLDLAATFPGLHPEISASIIVDLCATVAVPSDADPADRPRREATLVAELSQLRPRDLEEAFLASQILALQHAIMTCFRVATKYDVASKEASRLRRDAVALQRSLAGMVRAMHQSQARPISLEDDVPRPVVPFAEPRHPARHAAPPDDTAEQEEPADAAPPQRDPFEGQPDLKRLNEQWNDLPRWEDMTMEQRREVWGYVPQEPEASQPDSARPKPDSPAPSGGA